MKHLNPKDKEEIFGPSADAESEQVTVNQPEVALASVQFPQQQVVESVTTNFDAPACGNCGSMMIRAGSCYSCPNCFATTGVCN